MAKIASNVLDLIGGTPLVELTDIAEAHGAKARVLAKLEFYNPANSVKDRIGKAIVEAAEASGELKPGGTIIEATSGNTGIAIAMAAALLCLLGLGWTLWASFGAVMSWLGL